MPYVPLKPKRVYAKSRLQVRLGFTSLGNNRINARTLIPAVMSTDQITYVHLLLSSGLGGSEALCPAAAQAGFCLE